MSAIRSILRTIHAAVPETVRRLLDIATVNFLDTYDIWRLPTYRIRAPLVDDGIEATVSFSETNLNTERGYKRYSVVPSSLSTLEKSRYSECCSTVAKLCVRISNFVR